MYSLIFPIPAPKTNREHLTQRIQKITRLLLNILFIQLNVVLTQEY